MTATSLPAATARPPSGPPDLVWPVAYPADRAIRKVTRRLAEPIDLSADLYHHPFLGFAFVCRAPARRFPWQRPGVPALAHVVVDLVGGRAFLGDAWEEDSFTTRTVALRAAGHEVPAGQSSAPPGPAPRITQAVAEERGRALLAGVLARRRRLDPVGTVDLFAPPVYFGKPNWWVCGRRGDHVVEVIVDALSGRHYVCSG